jgi:hypothetical protein
MLTIELADRLRARARAAPNETTAQAHERALLDAAADRLDTCAGCAYCEHAHRAAKALLPEEGR